MNNAKIYKLIDPRDNLVKYVGKTENSLEYRLSQHLRTYFKSKKDSWIKKLIALNLKPSIELIEDCPIEIWEEREIYWIDYYSQFCKLKNMTSGGKGNNDQQFSKKTNIKRSNSLKGHVCKLETKEKIRKALTGKKISEKTKEKLRQINLGKIYSMETRLKKSKAVIMLDVNGIELLEFYSLAEAERQTKIRRGSISNVCRGFSKTAGSFKWKYK